MQKDMHYGAVLFVALSAGLRDEVAHKIAIASQLTDDFADSSIPFHVRTAHHTTSISNLDTDAHVNVWIPFHFLPGGEGDSIEDRLICRKNSLASQAMMQGYKNYVLENLSSHKSLSFAPYLIGIAMHVWGDTFSHYGFSGTTSQKNRVKRMRVNLPQYDDGDDRYSKEFEKYKKETKGQDARYDLTKFHKRYRKEAGADTWWKRKWRRFKGESVEKISGALGHGAALTYPDIHWLRFTIVYDDGRAEYRDNPVDFLEFLERAFYYFKSFDHPYWKDDNKDDLSWEHIYGDCRSVIDTIPPHGSSLTKWLELAHARRSDARTLPYTGNNIIREGKDFLKIIGQHFAVTDQAVKNIVEHAPVYRFCQAARFHLNYVHNTLLPAHKIIVVVDK